MSLTNEGDSQCHLCIVHSSIVHVTIVELLNSILFEFKGSWTPIDLKFDIQCFSYSQL